MSRKKKPVEDFPNVDEIWWSALSVEIDRLEDEQSSLVPGYRWIIERRLFPRASIRHWDYAYRWLRQKSVTWTPSEVPEEIFQHLRAKDPVYRSLADAYYDLAKAFVKSRETK